MIRWKMFGIHLAPWTFSELVLEQLPVEGTAFDMDDLADCADFNALLKQSSQ